MALDLGSCVWSELVIGEAKGLAVGVGESVEVDDGDGVIGESGEVLSRGGDWLKRRGRRVAWWSVGA